MVAGALLILACEDFDPVREEQELDATIVGAEGRGDLTGEAEVQWIESTSGFTATIRMQGDEPGAVRPWHVHFGTCETSGAIVGSDQDYPSFVVQQDGTASEFVSVPAPLTIIEQYHVDVHLSEEEMDTVIACGDFGDEPEEF